jgi:uncharacterized protein YukE
MSFKGMDPEQARDVAKDVTQAGEKIKQAFSDLDGTVQGIEWKGPDAEAFKDDWRSFESSEVSNVADLFKSHGDTLSDQADEQDQTSNSNA